MPQLTELQERSRRTMDKLTVETDELLVVDHRGQMTPAEMVEQKLLRLLESGAIAPALPGKARPQGH